MAQFRKKPIQPAQVAAVAAVTAGVTQAADTPAAPLAQNLGARQDLPPSPTLPPLPTPSAPGLSVGQVVEVPLERIRSNPLNPRAIYTTSAVDGLATSMSQHGQRVSATGYLAEDGFVVLIEGETRFRAARAAGMPALRVEIKPKPASDQALYEEARAANVERRDQTPLDDALRWKDLLARKVYPSQVALSRALGLKEDHVSRVLALAQMPLRLLDSLAEVPELLNLRMLTALREYWQTTQSDDATLELILEAARTGMGYRDVQQRRKAAARGPVRRPRSMQEALSWQGAKGTLKVFEESGRVELALKGLSPEAAATLTQRLRNLLAAAQAGGDA